MKIPYSRQELRNIGLCCHSNSRNLLYFNMNTYIGVTSSDSEYRECKLQSIHVLPTLNKPVTFCSDMKLTEHPLQSKLSKFYRRKHGKDGGIKKRIERLQLKHCLPSIIMGNVQSLVNKIGTISASCIYLHVFRNTSMLLFTETWPTDLHMNSHVSFYGFELLRGDENVHSR